VTQRVIMQWFLWLQFDNSKYLSYIIKYDTRIVYVAMSNKL